jgi:ubiquinol-cytochrome c reductase cytochrome b subunit
MIGDLVLLFLLGDFSISNPTLTRFLGFHVILPFILAAIVAFHLIFLHNSGSNNKGGAGMKFDVKNFLSLFMLKDFGFLN